MKKNLYYTKYGRIIVRKQIALINYIRYFKAKAHKYRLLSIETESEKAQLEMHFNRLKMTLDHFGKAIIKLDSSANILFGEHAALYYQWKEILKKTNVASKSRLEKKSICVCV